MAIATDCLCRTGDGAFEQTILSFAPAIQAALRRGGDAVLVDNPPGLARDGVTLDRFFTNQFINASGNSLLIGALGRRKGVQGGEPMDAPRDQQKIPGYDFGTDKVAKSIISMEEWEELKKSALFSEEDVVYLRLSEDVLADQIDDLLQIWRGIIFDHPHLRAYDEDPKTHEVDSDYAKAVAKRFGQWVLDTARAKYDRAWLDYQYEIGLRHHRSKKNKTDNGHTLGHIRARDLLAFSSSIVVPMRSFLAKKGHPPEIVSRMYDAWWKSMILQSTLWAQPYIREGDF
jgi:protoglobin